MPIIPTYPNKGGVDTFRFALKNLEELTSRLEALVEAPGSTGKSLGGTSTN